MNRENSQTPFISAAWQRRALAIGIACLLVCVLGGWWDNAQFFRTYLAAYLFYLGIALGSMVMLMVHHLTGGSWGLLIRRILEAAMRTLPLLALLFVPIVDGIGWIYPWAQPVQVAQSKQLQYQQFYLNPSGFWIRAAVYFALWLTIGFLLSRWSRQQDEADHPRLAWKNVKLSGFGLVLYGISIHFASIDWGMSIQPVFHSTIWGPLFALGQILSAFSFALVVLAGAIDRPPLRDVAFLEVRNDLGGLLLTILTVWAYLAWFQFMLAWIANLPADAIWYMPRAAMGWKIVIGMIFVLNFAVPFVLLLMRPIKRNSNAVAAIAGTILLMQLVFMDYQILPDLSGGAIREHWMDVLMPLGIGGIWLAFFFRQLQRLPLLAPNDANRAAALHLRHLDDEEASAYG